MSDELRKRAITSMMELQKPMSEEVQAQILAATDWFTQCPKCKAVLSNMTLQQTKEHKCG
jgi:hypothetical protein